MAHRVPLACVVFALSLISFATMAKSNTCSYNIRVRTGSANDAGTNSRISLRLESFGANGFTIHNLRDWGTMGTRHVYFQRGNTDVFRVTQRCINLCKIILTSDGAGPRPQWYVDFVQITVSGSSFRNINFPLYRWLGPRPNSLIASVDKCHIRDFELPLSSE